MSLNDLFGQRRIDLGLDGPQPFTAPLTMLEGEDRDAVFMKKAAAWSLKALHGRAATLNAMDVGEGKNDYLNKSAFVLLRFALAGHLDAQEVIDVMGEADGGGQYPQTRDTLKSAWKGANKHGPADPPIGQNVDADTYFEQLITAARKPSSSMEPPPECVDPTTGEVKADPFGDDATTVADAPTPEEQAAALSELIRKRLPCLDWHALWADESVEEWIVEPLLPARRLIALYSAPKVGKSLLLLELCCAIATGRDVLGVSIDRPRDVLYVDFENDPKADVRERLQAMGYGPDDLARLHYLSFPTLAALDTVRGGQELMAAVTEYQCEVVVIDTVSRAVEGVENENDTWLAFYRNTGFLLKKAGIALIRLDHAGKDEAKGQRGGSAKGGDVDAVWRLSKVNDETFRLDCEMARMPIMEKVLVLHREIGPLRHRVDAEGKSAAWRIKVETMCKALDRLKVPLEAGRPAVAAALRGAGLKAGDHLLKEVLKARQPRTSGPFEEE